MTEEIRYALGVDFGGTAVKIGLINDRGAIVARSKIATKDAASPEAWMDMVAQAAQDLTDETGIPLDSLSGMGIGVPGFVDFDRGFVHAVTNVQGWVEVHLAMMMRRKLGLKCVIDNDVNAMAIGEGRFGAGRGLKNAVFVTLGTGVGGGLLIEGKLYRGAHSMAGEIGHMSIDRHGLSSPQGKGGLELYVGNRAFVKWVVDALEAGRTSSVLDRAGGDLAKVDPIMINKAADEGDELACEAFDFMADCLATAFASVTYLIQPDVFIIGGGMGKSGPVLYEPLNRHLSERLSPVFFERISVREAELGNDAGMIGSGSLVFE